MADVALVATVMFGHCVHQVIYEVVTWWFIVAKKFCLCLYPVIHFSAVGADGE